jgi:hypothetical protein
MNKSYFVIAIAVMCIFGLSTSSRAQEGDAIVVKVPFDFIVSATTMPAGTYTVGHLFDDPHSGIVLHGDTKQSAVVLPTVVEWTSTFQPMLTFQHIGDKYFLAKIDTLARTYTISTRRPMMVLARTTDKTTVLAGGTN